MRTSTFALSMVADLIVALLPGASVCAPRDASISLRSSAAGRCE
jgi:hypothetical protein